MKFFLIKPESLPLVRLKTFYQDYNAHSKDLYIKFIFNFKRQEFYKYYANDFRKFFPMYIHSFFYNSFPP